MSLSPKQTIKQQQYSSTTSPCARAPETKPARSLRHHVSRFFFLTSSLLQIIYICGIVYVCMYVLVHCTKYKCISFTEAPKQIPVLGATRQFCASPPRAHTEPPGKTRQPQPTPSNANQLPTHTYYNPPCSTQTRPSYNTYVLHARINPIPRVPSRRALQGCSIRRTRASSKGGKEPMAPIITC